MLMFSFSECGIMWCGRSVIFPFNLSVKEVNFQTVHSNYQYLFAIL